MMKRIEATCLAAAFAIGMAHASLAATPDQTPGRVEVLNFMPPGQAGGGAVDITDALSAAVQAANERTHFAKDHPPQPACIHIPVGTFRISRPPPMFKGAGCVLGEGSGQSVLDLDPGFAGDLFAWSEAWAAYGTFGAAAKGFRVNGAKQAHGVQNALMFYDRNDNVSLDDVYINDMPGRAIAFGLLKPVNSAGQAYVRESNFRAVRIFGSGRTDTPAFEIASQGNGHNDGTNEINAAQIDIFASAGASLVIRNNGTGITRDIKFDTLRIEGGDGTGRGDLLQIGDPQMMGSVGHLFFTNLELLDPNPGHAAVRITSGGTIEQAPSRISLQGYIGGGLSKGEGLRIDSGSLIQANFNQIRTDGPNVAIGRNVKDIVLDGNGAETTWTYTIDAASRNAIRVVTRQTVPLRQ